MTISHDKVDGNDFVVVYYDREKLAIPYFRSVEDNDKAIFLTFSKVASTQPIYPFLMRDQETGSIWNLKGEAVEGTLKGKRLSQVPAHNAFWFAWTTFWQNTGVF